MLDRDGALKTVLDAYAARVRGDKEALAACWADDAHFEIVGARPLAAATSGLASPCEVVGSLIDQFHFSDLELLDAVVEGRTIAARWQVIVTVDGKAPVQTQLFDLIKLNDQGKIASFTPFADTALVRDLVE